MQSAPAIRRDTETDLIGLANGIQIERSFRIGECRGKRCAREHNTGAVCGVIGRWSGKIANAQGIVRKELRGRKAIGAEFAAGQR